MKFEIGQSVLHPMFGVGKVIAIKHRENSLPSLITVEFLKGICLVEDDDGKAIPDPNQCTYRPITRCFQETSDKLVEAD